MDTKKYVKQGGKFAATGAGIVTSSVVMGLVPSTVPRLAKGLLSTALGLGIMMFSSNQYVRAVGSGVGAGGILTVVKAATEGQTGILQTVNTKVPALGNPNRNGAQVMLPQRANDGRAKAAHELFLMIN